MNRFVKLAVSGATALGLCFAPISASAGPDGEDYAKALAGIALLGLIANAASQNRSGQASSASVASSVETIEGRRVLDGRFVTSDPVVVPHYKRNALTDSCGYFVRTPRGNRLVYGQRCLERTFRYASRLPESCERQVRTSRGVRTVFGAQCLRADGWTVAAR